MKGGARGGVWSDKEVGPGGMGHEKAATGAEAEPEQACKLGNRIDSFKLF